MLDVAGGRGVLSHELHVRHGLDVTLVDPLPVRLQASQRRHLKRLGQGLREGGRTRELEMAEWRRSRAWVAWARASLGERGPLNQGSRGCKCAQNTRCEPLEGVKERPRGFS